MKLNISTIKNAKAEAKPKRLTDGKGLYLLVNPNGSKWWRFDYRFNGKRKTLSMGVFPDVGLADARNRLMEARQLLTQGIDPSETRKAQKIKSSGINHFQNVAARWRDEMIADGEWTDGHALKTWRSLEAHVFPYIGNQEISTLGAPEIKPVLDRLADAGKTELQKKNQTTHQFNFQFRHIGRLSERKPNHWHQNP